MKFWTQTYPAMAGAIALASVFFVVVVEMVFSGMGAATHSHGGFDQPIVEPSPITPRPQLRANNAESPFLENDNGNIPLNGVLANGYVKRSHRRSWSGSIGRQLTQMSYRPEIALLLPTTTEAEDDLEGRPPSPTLSDKSDGSTDTAIGEATNLTR